MRRVMIITGLLAAAVLASHSVQAASAQSDRDAMVRMHHDPDAPCFRWPAVDMDGDGVFDRVDNCVNTPSGCTVDAHGCQTDSDQDGVCDGLDECPNTPFGKRVDARGCHEATQTTVVVPPPPAPAPQTGVSAAEREPFEIVLKDVNFATGSDRILPESEPTLEKLGRGLERYPEVRIEVQGHTDTRGSAEANMRLSQERADAVRQYLLNHYALSPENITARGYGETQPVTQETTPEELKANRRVVVKVLNPQVLPSDVKIER